MTSISLFFLLLLLSATAAIATLSSDLTALEAIKAAIDPATIPETSCLASWNFTSDPCSSNALPTHFRCGLSCGFENRITGLYFDGAGYSGTISPFISNLTGLLAIYLRDNKFHGPIPTALFSLPNLGTLDVRNNLFSGSIPPVISITKTLLDIDLSNNSLSGSLPPTLSSLSLGALNLSFNQFSGPIPILPPNLEILAIQSNYFSGHLRNRSFGGLIQLKNVDLSRNSLTGPIPGWFFLQPRLERVNLSHNGFTGIEVLKPNKTRLIDVDAGYNKIVGYLSANFMAYPELTSLSLRDNKLQGPIPKEFSLKNMMLRNLFLDGNYFNGKPSKDFFSWKSIVSGSFGDNCLKRCPKSSKLCLEPQKPSSICRNVYRGEGNR
ncbi:putative leucine-rich repeat domain superfamily [Helianthus annuus]|nr:putative leucine-rich repeat domain superfamily [Helianthus annuus]